MKVLIVVVAFLAIAVIIPLFINGEYAVEKEVSISKPKAEVFEYLKLLKNQDNFSVWASMDPDMNKKYTGTDGTVGFISAWDSKNKDVGKGEQEIMKITDGERIDYELRFIKPFEATDQAYIITESADENTTIVKWGFNGKMDYPMNIMMLFMDMEEMLGPQLEKGLTNLKKELENE